MWDTLYMTHVYNTSGCFTAKQYRCNAMASFYLRPNSLLTSSITLRRDSTLTQQEWRGWDLGLVRSALDPCTSAHARETYSARVAASLTLSLRHPTLSETHLLVRCRVIESRRVRTHSTEPHLFSRDSLSPPSRFLLFSDCTPSMSP